MGEEIRFSPAGQSARRDATSRSAEKSFFGFQPGHTYYHRQHGDSARNVWVDSLHGVGKLG